RKAALRPSRSPTPPKISAPMGRKAKPTPNRASEAISPAVDPSAAKKFFEMTCTRLPKMKKSYHSKEVPAQEAATTVRRDVSRTGDARVSSAVISAMTPPPTDDNGSNIRLAGAKGDRGTLRSPAT